jgi:hypothetical protein
VEARPHRQPEPKITEGALMTVQAETVDEEIMAATHGSRIVAALEEAWSAIRDRNPDVPPAVVITGSGANQKGTPEGYKLRGHHWPERWITGPDKGQRAPELFIAGELLSTGGRTVLEVMLHEAAHALAAARGIKDTSAEGNRYHNKRFVKLAEELGLRGPDGTDKVTGWSNCLITDQTAAEYAEAIEHINGARLPYLLDLGIISGPGEEGQDGEDGEEGTGTKPRRGGKRHAAECACQPPRRLQVTPKQLEVGPILCGVCHEPFEVPDDDEDQELQII